MGTFVCNHCHKTFDDYDGEQGMCWECDAITTPVKEGYGDGGASILLFFFILMVGVPVVGAAVIWSMRYLTSLLQ